MNLNKLMETSDSIGLCVLRVVTGVIFVAHGLPKFGWIGDRSLSDVAASFDRNPMIPLPEISAFLIASVETFGGALLVLGLFTRVVTAMQAFAMLVAVFAVHWSNGLTGPGGYQWALLMFAASFCLMIEGPGTASLDKKLAR